MDHEGLSNFATDPAESAATRWERWLKQFTNFTVANGITDALREKAILVHYAEYGQYTGQYRHVWVHTAVTKRGARIVLLWSKDTLMMYTVYVSRLKYRSMRVPYYRIVTTLQPTNCNYCEQLVIRNEGHLLQTVGRETEGHKDGTTKSVGHFINVLVSTGEDSFILGLK